MAHSASTVIVHMEASLDSYIQTEGGNIFWLETPVSFAATLPFLYDSLPTSYCLLVRNLN
jgi:hypothetical protein|tara:strand:+ start:310 stop:489 length:180 start_codon:yes stop_codon:yes gene_type:complete